MQLQNTRNHLLDVDIGLIKSPGYGTSGMKEILEAAGVPLGPVVDYFARFAQPYNGE